MSNYKYILTETVDKVALIRINRPKALNALNSTLMGELMDALAEFDSNPEIGSIVVTGDERAFAAGADIKEMAEASAVDMLKKDIISTFDRIKEIKKPVIAAVSGWCLGGGNELAMSCDMIVASESARFGQPEINLGVIPGAGGTQRLTRAVGKAIAMEMVLNNRTLTAEEALQMGLITRICEDREALYAEARKLAGLIAECPPLTVQGTKEVILHSRDHGVHAGLQYVAQKNAAALPSEDVVEAVAAFMEKRKPVFKGN